MNSQSHHQHTACITKVPIFNHLDTKSMELIAQKATTKNFSKGEFIYKASDTTDALFIVNKGSVRIFRIVDSGKEQLLRILSPGDFAGEWAIFNSGSPHEDYAQAMQATSLCIIYQEDFQNILSQYPNISLYLLREMSKRLDASNKQTTTLSTEQVDKRLAFYIADLIPNTLEDDVIVELPLTRKDIASYLGTTPETISRKFKDFEEQGLIKQLSSKKIQIPNVEELLFYI